MSQKRLELASAIIRLVVDTIRLILAVLGLIQ